MRMLIHVCIYTYMYTYDIFKIYCVEYIYTHTLKHTLILLQTLFVDLCYCYYDSMGNAIHDELPCVNTVMVCSVKVVFYISMAVLHNSFI